MKIWIAHEAGLAHLGPVPDEVEIEVFDGGAYPSDPKDVVFLVPPSTPRTPAELLEDMPNLEAVQLLSAGVETWVPFMPAGVALCDNRGAHTEATAEWVAAASLASVRRLDHFARLQAEREWAPVRTGTLFGKTALIVGAGSIGEAVARRFAALGMAVGKIARTARPGVGTLADLPELLPQADVVVVIVPLTAETEGLIDAAFLARMKDGALLVNAARGKVVDTAAITAEVASGRLRCALDVTEPEPLPAEHELWGLEGALITPHVGGGVDGFMERCYPQVGDQIRRLAAGEPLANAVENGY
ncbi:2-hydroxyacid dehydrogenase [Glycomyces sp. TRM65418]|uniref:2-hydroxyacid dehydrogenase n=1 Tax=Glycomyces sp. TRM65418 TaxID=2867006 RepID=UPI001CE638F1|nr:2-hydroxyacid dehydrogenase [Glycomyces sp. TRM65418]MCC3765708.1 2-hydroxyacid dehydrogenase [Glycomyces sp. TRM65418]QZD55302.1 2-hydroxyacid dehydrogenase [Glycomyces sp. TRM65418]